MFVFLAGATGARLVTTNLAAFAHHRRGCVGIAFRWRLRLQRRLLQFHLLGLATGFLGGFTTFSAFSLEAVSLWERGDGLLAAGYVLLSVVLSLAALSLGLWLMRSFDGGTI